MLKRDLFNKHLSFYNRYKLAERFKESARVLEKYPERIPIICEKNPKCTDLKSIEKEKYLVCHGLTCGQLIYIIRKNLEVPAEKAIYVMINGIIPSTSSSIAELYNVHKNEDGFLYIVYTSENVFG